MFFDQEPMMSRGSWRTNYGYSLTTWNHDLWPRLNKTVFDHFQHDKGTFGEGFIPSQNAEDIPEFHLGYPESLPNLPPNPWNPGFYPGLRMSQLIAGAGDTPMDAADQGDASAPTTEQRMQQLLVQITQMCTQNSQLQQELADAQRPEWGRRPPVRPQRDMFSLPHPPNYDGPPSHRPTGTWNTDQLPPLMGIKPILLQTPTPFKGEHDDIDRFLGDCQTYFETFRQYFPLHSQMVVFATSHLKGPAEDWWVHLQDGYWYVPPNDDKTDEAGP